MAKKVGAVLGVTVDVDEVSNTVKFLTTNIKLKKAMPIIVQELTAQAKKLKLDMAKKQVELVKVENEPNLKKDVFNGAVLNFDSQGLLAYKNLKKSQQNLNAHVDEINKIKDDISEIKSLLKAVIKEVK